MATPREIIEALSSWKLNLQKEKLLQSEIENLLQNAFQKASVLREYRLDDKSIIDFLVDDIGIEVKLKANKRAIYKQCERYCQFPEIKSLILITNTSIGFPETINGKDCYILKLGKAWL